MKQALIIFVRNPVPGKVKTRLAKTAGEHNALQIYISLLRYTRKITRDLACDKYVFYAGKMGVNDLWEEGGYHKRLQQGADLGEKMQHAFNTLFAEGYTAIAIIGSDCMELTAGIINHAFAALHHHEAAIGPSADGGYYLLALTQMHNRLFHNIPWSTEAVLQETIDRCRRSGLLFTLLPLLHDIDDEAGWNSYLARQAAAKELVFVYNAGSDLFSTVTDYVHKLLSPSTYACSLCALTHHHAGMRQEWKNFIGQLPYTTRFLHKDEFALSHAGHTGVRLPAVFLQQEGVLHLLLPAETINLCKDIQQLEKALLEQLKQHDLSYYTGVQ